MGSICGPKIQPVAETNNACVGTSKVIKHDAVTRHT